MGNNGNSMDFYPASLDVQVESMQGAEIKNAREVVGKLGTVDNVIYVDARVKLGEGMIWFIEDRGIWGEAEAEIRKYFARMNGLEFDRNILNGFYPANDCKAMDILYGNFGSITWRIYPSMTDFNERTNIAEISEELQQRDYGILRILNPRYDRGDEKLDRRFRAVIKNLSAARTIRKDKGALIWSF